MTRDDFISRGYYCGGRPVEITGIYEGDIQGTMQYYKVSMEHTENEIYLQLSGGASIRPENDSDFRFIFQNSTPKNEDEAHAAGATFPY